jgi:replicative DNA helicase
MINHNFIVSSVKFLLNPKIEDIFLKKEYGKKIKNICEHFIEENENNKDELLMINLEEKIKMLIYICKEITTSKDFIDYDHINNLMNSSKYKVIYFSVLEEINFEQFNIDNFTKYVLSIERYIEVKPIYDDIKEFNNEIYNMDSDLDLPNKLNELVKNSFYKLKDSFYEKDEFMINNVSVSDKNINNVLRTYGKLKTINKKIRSGLPGLDFCLSGGFETGRIYIMGATPGLGKSISLLDFMFNALNNTSPYRINDKKPLLEGRKKFNEFNYNKDIEELHNSLFIYFTLENRVNETLDRFFSLLLNRDATKTERINRFYNSIVEGIYNLGIVYNIIDVEDYENLDIYYAIKIYKKIMTKIKRGEIKKIEGQKPTEYLNKICLKIFGEEKFNKHKITIPKLLAGYGTYYSMLTEFLKHQNKYNNEKEIIYLEPYSSTIVDLSMHIDQCKAKHPNKKLRAVYVDYLDLMKSVNKTEQYRLELGYITAELKKLGNKYDVPIITATQLNSKGYDMDKSPKLSSITESKKKVEHADFVALMSQSKSDIGRYIKKLRTKTSVPEDDESAMQDYDPKSYGYNFINFDIQKNRNGIVKNIKQLFDYRHMTIYDEFSFETRDIQLNENNFRHQQSNIYDIISDLVKNKINEEQNTSTNNENLMTFDIENMSENELIDSFYKWF